MTGLVVGHEVAFHNADPLLHSVQSYRGTELYFHQPIPAHADDRAMVLASGKDGILALRCAVHPWARAYLVASTSHHFAVTGADGSFRLEGLPPGHLVVEVWHPDLGRPDVAIEVERGEVRE